MRYLIFLPLLLAVGCASQPKHAASTILVRNDTQLYYHGEISAQNTQTVRQLLAAYPKVDTLIITSGGGEVLSGIELGDMVHERQLQVRVRGACLSSCANYVVTASPSVLVEENALLGWHGGSLQPYYYSLGTSWSERFKGLFSDQEAAQKARQRMLQQWQQREADFFARIGTEQAVTILGMMPGLSEQRDSATFSYDPDTLQRLGLRIQFADGQPSTHLPSGDKLVQIFTLSEQQLTELLALNKETIASSTLE
jgi:hypothetical protein